jgi:hypothetical protein
MDPREPNYNSSLLSSVDMEISTIESTDRGTLEQTIDSVINQIPVMVKAVRDPAFKSLLQIKEGNDFVMGLAWGKIYTEFVAYLIASRGTSYDKEEGDKIAQIIMRRSAEIRDAIFNGG